MADIRPSYDIDTIRFGTDERTFLKAVALYEKNGVSRFRDNEMDAFLAEVRGSGGKRYEVYVSARSYDRGDCTCYLGQNDILCKHMIAVALWAVKGGEPLEEGERVAAHGAVCSGLLGELSPEELAKTRAQITAALGCIRPYNGPSRIWFAYQRKLDEGCARIAQIVSTLPVSKQTADLLVKLLLRLDRKLMRGGVDDSNGTVGGCMEEIIGVLIEYVALDPASVATFKVLRGRETCFDWEEPLLALFDKKLS